MRMKKFLILVNDFFCTPKIHYRKRRKTLKREELFQGSMRIIKHAWKFSPVNKSSSLLINAAVQICELFWCSLLSTNTRNVFKRRFANNFHIQNKNIWISASLLNNLYASTKGDVSHLMTSYSLSFHHFL